MQDDRLIAATDIDLANFVPHAPASVVTGKVIAMYGGVSEAGRGAIVTLNLGSKKGMESGHVLAMLSAGKVPVYRSGEKHAEVKLPNERYGLALIFRVFENVSYALVMRADISVQIGDVVETP